MERDLRILFVGGGTGGSAAPLLAIAEEIRRNIQNNHMLFVGSRGGPERVLVEEQKIPFLPIHSGKWRRYFSLRNVMDVFSIMVGFFGAVRIIRRFSPSVMVCAGSYVQVPVVWAGWIRRIPIILHQQDVDPGFANRLCASFARHITVTFESSTKHFQSKKTTWTGNPVRQNILHGSEERGRSTFELRHDLPVILAFGGGTGALALNQLIAACGLNLVRRAQILHITGTGKDVFVVSHPNYHAVQFLTNSMADAYALATVVVCRAGLSTLSELSALGKPAIIIPLPETHQERNARYFERHNAAVVLHEHKMSHHDLERTIIDLIDHPELRSRLSQNIRAIGRPDACERITKIILQYAHYT